MGQSILTANQQQLLESILTTPEITNQFYLTGGTALAEFYFQHRLSEDFDFFSEQPFSKSSILLWASTTGKKLKIEDVEYKTLNGQLTFFFHFPDSVVKVDFAQYPFPHLGEFKQWHNVKIANLLDIGVNKLQAIQTRKRGRDFVDLYFILEYGKLELSTLLKEYKNKFDLNLSEQETAKHFMGVLESIDQPKFLGETKWELIEQFFLIYAKKLSESVVK